MKFRKLPVVIDAVQLTWANWNEVCEFVPKPWFVRGCWLDRDGNPLPEDQWRFADHDGSLGLIIHTLEGDHLARGGDWIIRGVKGEFYPCKPDVFAETYESAQGTTEGAELISVERRRQIKTEGWTPEHDDSHIHGELAMAAVCYASYPYPVRLPWWPWEQEWWKPSDDPVRNLVKAGALIAAEIDRLQRKS